MKNSVQKSNEIRLISAGSRKALHIISIILVFSMMHYSCKTKTIQNDYCVRVIQNSPSASVLPESETNVIKSLFNSNRLDYTKYQFYQLDTDELGFKHVKSYQFIDNLRVFSEELSFHFNQNDTYYLLSGHIIHSTGLDAKPSLNPNKVAEIFIQKIRQEKASLVDTNTLKGCFEIELGYVGFDDSNEKFTKVWKAKPMDKEYPYAYIKDDTSEIIYYDNGVRY